MKFIKNIKYFILAALLSLSTAEAQVAPTTIAQLPNGGTQVSTDFLVGLRSGVTMKLNPYTVPASGNILLSGGTGISPTGLAETDGYCIIGAGGQWTVQACPASGAIISGTPGPNNLTKFASSTAITNGDLSGDVTTAGTLATTLATVNSNVGTFGSSSSTPYFTVNAKGLITAAASVPQRQYDVLTTIYYINGNASGTATCGLHGEYTCSAGNDSNDCLTPATACLTAQHAINLLFSTLDIGGVGGFTINLAHGSSTNYDFVCDQGALQGGITFNIIGDYDAPAAVNVIAANGSQAIFAKDMCVPSLSSFEITDQGTATAGVSIGALGEIDSRSITITGVWNNSSVLYGVADKGILLMLGQDGNTSVTNTINSTAINQAFGISNGALVDFANQTVAIPTDMAINQTFMHSTGGEVVGLSTGTFTGTGATGSTGGKCLIEGGYLGSEVNPNSVFPGNTNCVPYISTAQVNFYGSNSTDQRNNNTVSLQAYQGGSFTAWNATWPTTAGTSGQVLASVGGGTTPMTWTSTIANATNTAITDDNSTNAQVYPTWVTSNTGNLPQKTSSSKLAFNPSTGNLTATGFLGTATNASNIGINNDASTNATMYPVWVNAVTGYLQASVSNSKLNFNPSTGIFSSTGFSGAGTGLTGTAASLTAGTVTTNANSTGDVTSVGNATTIAANAVTNAKAAQMAANTIKGNNTGSLANAADLTVPQVQVQLMLPYAMITATGVNFNSANTDTAITLPALPTGFTRFRFTQFGISGASAAINGATFGVFPASGGSGTPIVASGTACTITTASDATNNNLQFPAVVNGSTLSFTLSSVPTVYFRVQTAEGSAATANVMFIVQFLP